ncbi:DUF2977 domain-containing protein [Liquorilactobacillus sp.]|uniref:DUF2977 domain-containing protein n=1 Tax=Liquorilactobacillus sp. TaxID=2767923 RepID=UPI0039EC57F1
MKLDVDSNNLIQGFTQVGDNLDCKIEIDSSALPNNFMQNFKPGYYLYKNGNISVNPNYTEPIIADLPSAQQKFNANLMLQLATLTAKVTKLEGGAS